MGIGEKMAKTYKEMHKIKLRRKIDEFLQELPDFWSIYIRGRENRLSENSMLSYCYKMRVFLLYLKNSNSYFGKKEITDYTLEDMDLLQTADIDQFAHWLAYNDGEIERVNCKNSVERYLACLNQFWSYNLQRGYLSHNPLSVMDRFKPKDEPIIYLHPDEENQFLNTIAYGTGLSKRQQVYHEKNMIRDMAICHLFLYTGIRISELVGIDVQHINFSEHYVMITKKGDERKKVYFSDITESYLLDYLKIRHNYHPAPTDLDYDALFLSLRGTRLSVRAIEKLVKKYFIAGVPNKDENITPHKLRSTFAMNMLHETGDIALVSEQLGHKSMNTTRRYARSTDEDQKAVRNILPEYPSNNP